MLPTVLLGLAIFPQANAQIRALIYSAVEPGQFVHDSIPAATDALISRGSAVGIRFDSRQDASIFTDAGLDQYDGLVFLMNVGEAVLDDNGKAALQRYLDKGRTFIAIHSASDALRGTAFYGEEVGAFFDYHPELQNATVDVIDSSHPSTSMLPAQWHVQDEMYNFKSNPRSIGAVVLLSANESSYTDPGPRKFSQGSPHPTAWYQEHGAGVSPNGIAGRSFYTSLGHLSETWQDELFIGHVMGGIQWALATTTTTTNTASLASGTISASAASLTASSQATGSVS
ncbi:ThuA-like domain-containing protein [Vararia minispora EC-137]|uniref:ThuA-like domain-containing protein n=1 Tax=Vararia minispora EC-137 TaxID=1314806 RepID=A0ACB8QLA6_9AGAM|nr:ThuA-like domain-containing protein [Vararia minispora EC-137]